MSDSLADLEAEVLGAVLQDASLAGMLTDTFRPEQFTGWRIALAEAIVGMSSRGLEISPTTVAEHLRVSGQASRCGHLQVLDAYSAGLNVIDPKGRFSLLSRRCLQRDTAAFATRLLHMSENSDPAVALEFAKAEAERLIKLDGGTTHIEAPTMTEFLGLDFPDQEWAIPRLLPASTSAMITATEGMGKTVFLRQLAVSAALGVDPFDPADRSKDYQPQRTLIVDCEYSGRQVQRQLRSVAAFVDRHKTLTSAATDRIFVHSVQHGIDLTDPADQAVLRGLIRSHRPTMLVIGPLYRATSKGYMDEDATREWQRPLEAVMAEGVSVVVEHHIGNEGPDGRRSLRPIGSSAMRRWAAQGMGFRQTMCKAHQTLDCKSCGRTASVEKWRGSRDETYWPTHIKTPTSGGYWWERDITAEGMAA